MINLFRRRKPEPRPLTDWEREMLTTGLAGFCAHGIGMLDQCDDCCPPKSPRGESDTPEGRGRDQDD